MTTTRDVVRSGAFAPLQVQTYGQIPNVLDLPNLIKIQLDSFEWFKRERPSYWERLPWARA